MKDGVRVYHLYGLRVHSEIALPAPIARSDIPSYDLQVCWGERKAMSDEPPAGQILATLVLDNGRGYTLVDTGRGFTLRFHRTGEVWIDPDLRVIRVHLAADVHPDIAGLLVVGNVMACLLTLAGESVLHASAVEIGGSALAFLGSAGMGKSSLAALLCANGARLITDDVLRLQPNGKGWRCLPGTGHLRLRKNAAVLVEHVAATRLEATPDDRIAVYLAESHSMPLLGALVIPHLSRRCHALTVERIPRSTALLYLMAYPRIRESGQRDNLQRRLDFFGRLAASIPVFTAEIPWGLPFSTEIAAALARGVGLPELQGVTRCL